MRFSLTRYIPDPLLQLRNTTQRGLMVASDKISAAVHGMLGSHSAETLGFSPITAAFRNARADVEPEQVRTGNSALIFTHGLMDDELSWTSNGWVDLCQQHSVTPVLFRHPSGEPIPRNGASLANLIERLTEANPRLQTLHLVGYSQGGLINRSAVHYALTHGLKWPYKVRHLIFIGTPLMGADLERVVAYASSMLGFLPALRPWFLRPVLQSLTPARFALLPELIHFFSFVVPGLAPGLIRSLFEQRSHGIRDLRHGRYRWQDKGLPGAGEPFPPTMDLWCIAGLMQPTVPVQPAFWHTDGMVSLPSAMNLKEEGLVIHPECRFVVPATTHYTLLGRQEARDAFNNILSRR